MDVCVKVVLSEVWCSQRERKIVTVQQHSFKGMERKREEEGKSGWCTEVSYIPSMKGRGTVTIQGSCFLGPLIYI